LLTDRLDKYNPNSVINSEILNVYFDLMYSCKDERNNIFSFGKKIETDVNNIETIFVYVVLICQFYVANHNHHAEKRSTKKHPQLCNTF
jgi:hypothetical protein